ncbi:hypothetical protein FACS1894137_19300 [Spirochaetia bacterium]|nr:hypothetical protein FACS1894137_19300 [Spirochaetia bacterium]
MKNQFSFVVLMTLVACTALMLFGCGYNPDYEPPSNEKFHTYVGRGHSSVGLRCKTRLSA